MQVGELFYKMKLDTSEFDKKVLEVGNGIGKLSDKSIKINKNYDQKIASMAIMQALYIITQKLNNSSINIKPEDILDITHAGYMFAGLGNFITRKESSSDRNTQDILIAMDNLDTVSGNNTYIHEPLEKIYDNFLRLTHSYQSDVLSGKEKYIVMLMSDGQTENNNKTKIYIDKLRALGVIIYGIGITDDGKSMETIFAETDSMKGKGITCSKPTDLAQTIHDLMIDILDDVDGGIG